MVELTFNFVGVNAVDFQRAFAFYTDVLGVHPAEPTPPDDSESWAMLVQRFLKRFDVSPMEPEV